jgi:hypothetical protein
MLTIIRIAAERLYGLAAKSKPRKEEIEAEDVNKNSNKLSLRQQKKIWETNAIRRKKMKEV